MRASFPKKVKGCSLARCFFLHSVDQGEKYHHRQNAQHHANQSYVVHASPLLELNSQNLQKPSKSHFKKCSKYFASEIAAGPSRTMPIAGAIKSASGKSSLMVVFAAISSAFCRRWVRSASENAPSDFEIGVPKRSVWTNMPTNERTISRSTRSENDFQAVMRGTPARCSKLICNNSSLRAG